MYQTGNLVKELSDKHGRARESLMPILQEIVRKNNYLTDEVMVEVARELDISAAEVYGTATFYHYINTTQKGKYIIRVCQSISCDMANRVEVMEALEKALNIKVGETSSDGLYTLEYTNCMGMCDQGPALLINKKIYTKVTPESIKNLIQEIK